VGIQLEFKDNLPASCIGIFSSYPGIAAYYIPLTDKDNAIYLLDLYKA